MKSSFFLFMLNENSYLMIVTQDIIQNFFTEIKFILVGLCYFRCNDLNLVQMANYH